MTTRNEQVRAVLERVQREARTALTAPECATVCAAYEIPLPREGLAKSADQAAQIAAEIGFPVVLKIVSSDILHKTEAGGVVTGVANGGDVKAAYASITRNAKAYKADAKIDGVQVQQMVKQQHGQEVIVGASAGGRPATTAQPPRLRL